MGVEPVKPGFLVYCSKALVSFPGVLDVVAHELIDTATLKLISSPIGSKLKSHRVNDMNEIRETHMAT